MYIGYVFKIKWTGASNWNRFSIRSVEPVGISENSRTNYRENNTLLLNTEKFKNFASGDRDSTL